MDPLDRLDPYGMDPTIKYRMKHVPPFRHLPCVRGHHVRVLSLLHKRARSYTTCALFQYDTDDDDNDDDDVADRAPVSAAPPPSRAWSWPAIARAFFRPDAHHVQQSLQSLQALQWVRADIGEEQTVREVLACVRQCDRPEETCFALNAVCWWSRDAHFSHNVRYMIAWTEHLMLYMTCVPCIDEDAHCELICTDMRVEWKVKKDMRFTQPHLVYKQMSSSVFRKEFLHVSHMQHDPLVSHFVRAQSNWTKDAIAHGRCAVGGFRVLEHLFGRPETFIREMFRHRILLAGHEPLTSALCKGRAA